MQTHTHSALASNSSGEGRLYSHVSRPLPLLQLRQSVGAEVVNAASPRALNPRLEHRAPAGCSQVSLKERVPSCAYLHSSVRPAQVLSYRCCLWLRPLTHMLHSQLATFARTTLA